MCFPDGHFVWIPHGPDVMAHTVLGSIDDLWFLLGMIYIDEMLVTVYIETDTNIVILSPTSVNCIAIIKSSTSLCSSSLEWSRMAILWFQTKITWASFDIDLIIQMNFLMVFLCVQFLNCSSKLKYNFILWIISYDL